jgi:hypothetical protein
MRVIASNAAPNQNHCCWALGSSSIISRSPYGRLPSRRHAPEGRNFLRAQAKPVPLTPSQLTFAPDSMAPALFVEFDFEAQTIRNMDMVAIGRVVLTSREHIIVLL